MSTMQQSRELKEALRGREKAKARKAELNVKMDGIREQLAHDEQVKATLKHAAKAQRELDELEAALDHTYAGEDFPVPYRLMQLRETCALAAGEPLSKAALAALDAEYRRLDAERTTNDYSIERWRKLVAAARGLV
jgi:hypothetical protein